MKEVICNNHKWSCRSVDPKCSADLWCSNWWCSDGDGVALYIEKDKSGFELNCFSGIPASKIFIDIVDFATLWRKTGTIYLDNPIKSIGTYSFEEQCIIIADYLCSLFCEYTDTTNQ